MKRFFFILLFAFLANRADAQVLGPGIISLAGEFINATVATLPSPTSGTVRYVTDGASASDCDTGGGSTGVLCVGDGTDWVSVGSAGGVEADTLDTVFDRGKTINGADSFANAVKVTDATGAGCGLYTHASLGPQNVCFPASGVENDLDYYRTLLEGKNWGVKDNEGEIIFAVAEATGAVTFPFATKQPTKSIWFGAGSLSTDGTQCAAPAEVTINSGPKLWSVICTDNDASTIYGSVKMPDSWNGGTVTFTQVYIQTAADTAVLNGDIACQARSNGEVPSVTYGTEVALDDAAVVGGNSNDMVTSLAATCAGTGVAGGDMLYFRYQLDATGTTTAVSTLHHLGFMLEYVITGLSD